MNKNYFLVKALHHGVKVLEEILVNLDIWMRMRKHNHSIVRSAISSGFFSAKSFKFMSEHPVIVKAKIPTNISFFNTNINTQFNLT